MGKTLISKRDQFILELLLKSSYIEDLNPTSNQSIFLRLIVLIARIITTGKLWLVIRLKQEIQNFSI